MFQVYQCSYCNTCGREEAIRKHENVCEFNPNLKTCFTCKYQDGVPWKCGHPTNPVTIPTFQYMQDCAHYEETQTLPYDPHSLYQIGPSIRV